MSEVEPNARRKKVTGKEGGVGGREGGRRRRGREGKSRLVVIGAGEVGGWG